MLLRNKALAVIFIALAILIVVVYSASQVILMGSYATLEDESTRSLVDTAQREISYDLSTLVTSGSDYATWDDTYTFIEDGNSGYIESNMGDNTLVNLRLNIILYVNASGGLVYGKSLDLESGKEVPMPTGLLENVKAGNPLLDTQDGSIVSGVLMVPSGPLLIAACPILMSDGGGTPRGTLIMGRYLGEDEISLLSDIAGVEMTVQLLNGQSLPADFDAVVPELASNDTVVRPIDGDTISGYGLVRDIYGNPTLIIRVDTPRLVYQQGQASVGYFMLALALSGLAMSLIAMFVMHRTAIGRISRLRESVRRIGAENDLSVRLPEGGDDEVAGFARTMNATLDSLEHYRLSLASSEHRFRSLVENINDIVWEVNEQLEFIYVSPNVGEMLGYEPGDVIGKTPFDLSEKDTGKTVGPVISDLVARHGSFALVEMKIKHRNGSLVSMEISGTPRLDEKGKITGFRGIARDIRQRKEIEKTLRKWADIFQSTRMPIVICGPDSTRFEMINPAFANLYGYTMEEMKGLHAEDVIIPEHRKDITSHMQIAAREGHLTFESVHVKKDGTRFPVLLDVMVVKDDSGRILYQIINVQDITERKRAEETLRRSEEEFRVLAESSPVAIFFHSGKNLLYVNPAAEAITGYTRDELLAHNYWDFIAPEHRDIVKERGMARLFGESLPVRYEAKIITKQGVERWIGLMSTRTEFRGQMAILAIVQDITERVRAEESLKRINDELESRVQRRTAELKEAVKALTESERKYRELVQNANSMIIRFGMDGRITYFNEFACTFFGYSQDEIIGKNVLETIVPKTESSGRDLSMHVKDLLERPDEYMINVNENVRRNGERVWVSWTNKVMLDEGGCVEGILAIGNDITDLKHASDELKRVNDTLEFRVQQRTGELASAVEALRAEVAERKRVEAQMQSSLQEKEVLLKEIHHRVKNNLQIISSLLSLQSENINNENPAITFKESQDRIRSMALIHEKLYQARDISRVNFSEYVRSLTSYLSRSYMRGPGIEVVIDIEDVSLGIDTAIPCGLIINELVSNSLKYAFRGERTGEIRVSLTRSDNSYTLTVSDNGVGLPPGFDFRNTPSLGLQLVNTLVSQLEGSIVLDSSHGTMFRIMFAEQKSSSP